MKNTQLGTIVLAMGLMGCGGGDSSADAGLPAGDAGGDAGGDASGIVDSAVVETDSGQGDPQGDQLLACATKPAVAVTDLSGTWVLREAGAQVVKAAGSVFHVKSVKVVLVKVTQTGDAVTLDGRVCDRIQQDDPANPAKVVIPDAWRLTEWPFKRSGTFAAGASGVHILVLPNAVDVVGAHLTDPLSDKLPTDTTDPRLSDDDKDGNPGITINLTGAFAGSLYSVQRDQSVLAGVPVAADRVEGGMTYLSDQSVIDSKPGMIKTLYASSTSSPDPAACSSSFVMLKVPDTATCAWARDNEATLFGP